MKKPSFKKKAYVWGAALCVLVCLTVSCGRVGPCYIEAPLEKVAGETARLHFFFDKTFSMRGFVEKGDESQYVKTLPLLWQAADTAFAASSTRFYEYGTQYTNEFRSPEAAAYVKREVLHRGFYGNSAITAGIRVKSNNG
jgi:hypothetical protein